MVNQGSTCDLPWSLNFNPATVSQLYTEPVYAFRTKLIGKDVVRIIKQPNDLEMLGKSKKTKSL